MTHILSVAAILATTLAPCSPRGRRTRSTSATSFPESDLYFGRYVTRGAFRKFFHERAMTPIDKQEIVRVNRDTLYSFAIFDLDAAPVSVTLPDVGKRFMSMQVISEDQLDDRGRLRAGPVFVYQGEGRHALRVPRDAVD
jgi:hypothetical protein